MNIYLFIKVKGGGVHKWMYMYGNTESALTTEYLDGYLPNLVEIKYSWPCTFVLTFGPNPPGVDPGRAKIGHGGSPSPKDFFFRPEGYSNKPNA